MAEWTEKRWYDCNAARSLHQAARVLQKAADEVEYRHKQEGTFGAFADRYEIRESMHIECWIYGPPGTYYPEGPLADAFLRCVHQILRATDDEEVLRDEEAGLLPLPEAPLPAGGE